MAKGKVKNTASVELADTFPKILRQNYERYGNKKVAMRKKDLGIWQEYTWENCYNVIKHLALGLLDLGLKWGDKVCIIGDSATEWFWAELAVQSIGGASVGLYVDSLPEEIKYIVNHSDSVFAIVKDQEQVDKFLEIRDQLPALKRVIYWDQKGMWAYSDNPFVMSFEDVVQAGQKYEEAHLGLFEQMIERTKSTEMAIICYTSGTTGVSKGVMINNYYLTNACRQAEIIFPILDTDDYLSYVPLAWIAEQFLGVGLWLTGRRVVNFPESPDTVQENIKEIGPQFMLLGPRQWEDLMKTVRVRIDAAGGLRKLLYSLCLPIGYKLGDSILEERRLSPLWHVLFRIADWLCFRPIRDYLGLARLRAGLSGALGPDAHRWFKAMGVDVREAYALTECQLVCMQGEKWKLMTVGPPAPGASVRINDEGEIFVTTGWIFQGYYKQPDETAKVIRRGWVKTGDAGHIDEEGNLVVLDRVKDMLKLKEGKKYSPTFLENALKFGTYIKDAMVVGGETRDYIFATVNIDFNNVGKWAERNRIPYTTYVDLSQKQEVYEIVRQDIRRVNKVVPLETRIKRYALLTKELDSDEGELTRSRKLRRAFVEERQQKLINAAYADETTVEMEIEITYRDGRTGSLQTSIAIWDVE